MGNSNSYGILKIYILGDKNSGKNTFIQAYKFHLNFPSYKDTIPDQDIVIPKSRSKANFIFNKKLEQDVKIFQIKVYVYDTFDDKKVSFFQESDIVLLMFDVNNRISWENQGMWINFLMMKCAIKKLYFIGNYKNQNEILTSEEEIQYLIGKIKEMEITYALINSKESENVSSLLDDILQGNLFKAKNEGFKYFS